MPHDTPLILTIDVGTGSVRAGLVDAQGTLLASAAAPHATLYPGHSRVEQRPRDWWVGAVAAIAGVLAQSQAIGRIAALVCCGQMHAPVLIDADGALVLEAVPLWNDKRAAAMAAAWPRHGAVNPPTSAWPGIKLRWLAQHDPRSLERAKSLMMPKDYLNYRLTGAVAMDWTEAGSSFLADAARQGWSDSAAQSLGVPRGLLPPLLRATDRVGCVTAAAAAETGLPAGLPVLAGAGDFPAAILGSGVTEPGQVSDITGTSFLLTRLVADPVHHPDVMNVAATTGGWGAFAVVDAAGDAVRWAARSLDRDQRGFDALSAEAATAPAGAEGLIFLPYLTGERLGQGEASRAAFLGLTARHGPAHLHRAVMEGVVLAMREAFAPIAELGGAPDRIVSAAGGARSDLWLQIKADVLDCEVIPTEHAEAGMIGCAALGLAGLGAFSTPAEAARALVRHRPPFTPDPARRARYDDLYAAFRAIRRAMLPLTQSAGQPT